MTGYKLQLIAILALSALGAGCPKRVQEPGPDVGGPDKTPPCGACKLTIPASGQRQIELNLDAQSGEPSFPWTFVEARVHLGSSCPPRLYYAPDVSGSNPNPPTVSSYGSVFTFNLLPDEDSPADTESVSEVSVVFSKDGQTITRGIVNLQLGGSYRPGDNECD